MKNKYQYPLYFSLTLIAGILLGWVLRSENRTSDKGTEKLLNVIDIIQANYVEDLNMDSLVEMVIPEMMKNLDPHSSYIPARDLESVNSELDGKFSGVGISFQIFNDTLNVVEVISNGPAEKVGMLPGDRIIKVDDKVIAGTGITEDDVFSMLRGEKGTEVKLTVKRNKASKPLIFDVIRDDIPVESVDAAYMINENTGLVKVARFGRRTYEEFITALAMLKLNGAENFIIDLRNNGGGYMEPAVLMANEFLPAGRTIVSVKGRDPHRDQILLSDGTGAFQDAGIVVLLNEFSASASEIFSGAMQDNDRGWILGRRSFGKGLVQSPIMLPDQSELRLTVQRYYTPSGRCIQKDYKPGDIEDYELELINRYNNGEMLNADSVKLNLDQKYETRGGRTVYGGGGIMPDYFVPNDTAKITSYYRNINNQNLPMRFAYEFYDNNRAILSEASNVDQLLPMLPSDDELLYDFVRYAASKGEPARWYYINISAPLIVNQLKALIARNCFGMGGYYEVANRADKAVEEAIRHVNKPLEINN